MKLVSYDGVAINGEDAPQGGIPNDSDRGQGINLSFTPRRKRAPRLRRAEPQERRLLATIYPPDGATDTDPYLATFEQTVHWLFRRDGEARPLVARRVPPAPSGEEPPPDTLMTCMAVVSRLTPDGRNRGVYTVELTVPDGTWYEDDVVTETTSPITVTGSAYTYPVVTVTSSATGVRKRVTITDRTEQGLIGWLTAIPWTYDAAETWLWINGVPMPFTVDTDNDRLWFRADVLANSPTIVDVYRIAGSNNALHADMLDTAGTSLSAGLAAGTSVAASIETAGRNAVSASLTWHPMPTAAHYSGTPYTFGLSAPDTVALLDRTATGRREQLGDDADSLVFTSPVEFTGVAAMSVSVVSGYRLPEAAADELDTSSYVTMRNTIEGPAVLRVKLGGIVGAGLVAPVGDYNLTGPPPAGSLTVSRHRKEMGFSVDPNTATDTDMYFGPGSEPWPPQSSNLIFALAGSDANAIRDSRAEFIYIEDDPETDADETIVLRARNASIHPDNVTTALQRAADAASVSYAGDWVWYVTFAQGSYGGQEIPLLSVTNTVDTAILVEQAWVDPVTLKPIVDNRDAGAPANGAVRVVQRYRVRDDETWYTAWSRVVQGTRDAAPQAITIPALSVPAGMVQVAVGLESSANGAGAIDWGVLTVSGSPVLTFASGVTPLVEVSGDIEAMRITGSVAFDTDGDALADYRLGFRGVFCDDGIALDCEAPWTEGAGGVGPVYGDIEYSDPDVWLALGPGTAAWATTGDVDTVEVEYRTAWSV